MSCFEWLYYTCNVSQRHLLCMQAHIRGINRTSYRTDFSQFSHFVNKARAAGFGLYPFNTFIRAVLIEIPIAQISRFFSPNVLYFHIFQLVFPNIGMRIPNVLPSVKFLNFGNVSCFFLLGKKEENLEKSCSIRTALTTPKLLGTKYLGMVWSKTLQSRT